MSKKQKQKKTSFSFIAPEAQSVQLAGDFNSWDPIAHPMERKTDERWEINLNLSPGRYEYKFVVDGQWRSDPNCSDFASNPFGDDNSVLILK
jgi:1,4-alpha-glucan branching enzyme